jgi:DNA-binding NarL/FixJ family response regulator
VDKESNAGAFLDAIRCVLLDGQAISLGPIRLAPQRRNFNLTPRERQIVAEVAAAHPNKEIARRLNISEQTVKRHVNTVFTKLGVSNRVELTLFATYWGLLHDSQIVQLASRLGESSLAG